jgi:hypothetical protein
MQNNPTRGNNDIVGERSDNGAPVRQHSEKNKTIEQDFNPL